MEFHKLLSLDQFTLYKLSLFSYADGTVFIHATREDKAVTEAPGLL